MVGLCDVRRLVVDLLVRVLAVLSAVGHEAASNTFEVGDAGLAQHRQAVGAGLGVWVGALLLRGSFGVL